METPRGPQFYSEEKPLRSRLFSACALLAALSAALLLLLPAARNGAKLVANELFTASEARNAYLYQRFGAAQPASQGLALALLLILALALFGLAAAGRRHLAAAPLALALAFSEIYFGLTPPAALNLLLFASLAAAALWDRKDPRPAALCLAASLLMLAATSLLAPGVDARLEERSERWRDLLAQSGPRTLVLQEEAEPESLAGERHQNRLNRTEGEGGAGEPDYALEQRAEEELSLPLSFSWLKTLFILLLVVLLLVLPFLPFLLAGERGKRAKERRKAFDAEDSGEAVRAMFLHCVAYLDALFPQGENRNFSAPLPEALPEDYKKEFEDARGLWLLAAYGGQSPSLEERERMRAFLDKTEELLYDRSGLKTRWRLKYIECLHE